MGHLLLVLILLTSLDDISPSPAWTEGSNTHSIFGLLIFVSLLVSSGLLLVRLALLLTKSLPLVAENLANLPCESVS